VGDFIRVLVPSSVDKEAIQTRDYCVAKNATHRAARPDPSRCKERLLGMTIIDRIRFILSEKARVNVRAKEGWVNSVFLVQLRKMLATDFQGFA
jgi:hypothetical protein